MKESIYDRTLSGGDFTKAEVSLIKKPRVRWRVPWGGMWRLKKSFLVKNPI